MKKILSYSACLSIGIFLLCGCNSSGGGAGAAGSTNNTPFVGANFATTATQNYAYYSIFPGTSVRAARLADRSLDCSDLIAEINANGSLAASPILHALTTVTCDGSTCTADPANVWLDKNGKVVTDFAQGNYTIFVRFTDDLSDVLKPTDALLCQEHVAATGDDISTTLSDSEHSAMAGAVPPSRDLPSVFVECTNNNAKCTSSLTGAVTDTYVFKGKTCDDLQGEIASNFTFTSKPDASIQTGGVRSTGITCGPPLGRGSENVCSYSIDPGDQWFDGHGQPISQVLTGDYAVLSVIQPPARTERDDNPIFHGNEIFQCKDWPLPTERDVDVSMDDTNTLTFETFSPVVPDSVLAQCHSAADANCTSDHFNGADSYAILVKDKTCNEVKTAIANGTVNSLPTLAQAAGPEVTCNPTDRTPESTVCSFSATEWNHAVPEGSYALVTVMDRFNDLQTGPEGDQGPKVGDIVQCKAVSVPPATRGEDYTLTDTDTLKNVAWTKHLTPTISATCNSSVNPICTTNFQINDPITFVGINISCSDLTTNGLSEDIFDKIIAVEGDGKKLDRHTNRFDCGLTKTDGPAICSFSTPGNELTVAHSDNNDFNYFRNGTYTVATLVQSEDRDAGPAGVFCRQMPWNASTTTASLGNANLTLYTPPAPPALRPQASSRYQHFMDQINAR